MCNGTNRIGVHVEYCMSLLVVCHLSPKPILMPNRAHTYFRGMEDAHMGLFGVCSIFFPHCCSIIETTAVALPQDSRVPAEAMSPGSCVFLWVVAHATLSWIAAGNDHPGVGVTLGICHDP